MNAKKCDRCGKYYDKNEKHKGRNKGEKRIAEIATVDDVGWPDRRFDLCDDCIAEFEKFIKAQN